MKKVKDNIWTGFCDYHWYLPLNQSNLLFRPIVLLKSTKYEWSNLVVILKPFAFHKKAGTLISRFLS
jgi:hypothetical protein